MDEPAVRAQLAEADITVGPVHRNLPAPELIARSLARGEGIFAANGALVVTTGERTGRSPADRYIVDEPEAEGVAWGGANQACTPEFFDRQVRRVSDYLRRREVYVFDGFIGAEPTYRTPIRVVSRASWHGLFAHTLFVRPEPIDLEDFEPAFTVINCGELAVDARPEGEERRRPRRATLAGVRRHQPEPPSRHHPRHHVRRRDQEVPLLGHELPAARAQRAAHALLGHGRQEGRRGSLLRPLGHRQDHAVGRPDPPPHRRRRARLERPRRVQLRGRMLRQGHPPLAGARAADLQRHPLRVDPRERDHRPAHAGHRLGRRLDHREHARHVPGQLHPERHRDRPRRHAAQRVPAGLRRLRRAAARSPGSRRRWPATTSSPASPPRWPARRPASRSPSRRSRRASAPRSCRATPWCTRTCWPSGCGPARRSAGWSTPAGAAARPRTRSGCRSR